MANLYYLMSSLPSIAVSDESPRISYEELLRQAENALSEGDYARLVAFNLSSIPNSLKGLPDLEQSFWRWEIALRNELVYLRAKAFNTKADAFIREGVSVESSDIKRAAQAAFDEADPMQVELELNKARWALLESRRPLDYFHVNSLMIYSMQLQLITRRSLFTKEQGEANYQKEYELILGEAKTVLMENIR